MLGCTPSSVLGGQYASELAGGNTFTHQGTSVVVASGRCIYAISYNPSEQWSNCQSAVVHLVVEVKAALAIEMGDCTGADAATLRVG